MSVLGGLVQSLAMLNTGLCLITLSLIIPALPKSHLQRQTLNGVSIHSNLATSCKQSAGLSKSTHGSNLSCFLKLSSGTSRPMHLPRPDFPFL
jgi:hypothetical protein